MKKRRAIVAVAAAALFLVSAATLALRLTCSSSSRPSHSSESLHNRGLVNTNSPSLKDGYGALNKGIFSILFSSIISILKIERKGLQGKLIQRILLC